MRASPRRWTLTAPVPRLGGPRPRRRGDRPRRRSNGTGTEQERPVIMNAQVTAMCGGEPACRPGSVRPLARADGHPSGTAVADSLVRSTREHRAGHPRPLAQAPRPERRTALVTLLRVGFTEPPGSLRALVVSYTTVSPLPRPGRNPGRGGLFSVALSRGSPRVGVTDHPALWSPDLPHRAVSGPARPPGRLALPQG